MEPEIIQIGLDKCIRSDALDLNDRLSLIGLISHLPICQQISRIFLNLSFQQFLKEKLYSIVQNKKLTKFIIDLYKSTNLSGYIFYYILLMALLELTTISGFTRSTNASFKIQNCPNEIYHIVMCEKGRKQKDEHILL